MARILISWVGATDLRAAAGDPGAGVGPVAQALASRAFDEVVLLSDYPEPKVSAFFEWLQQRSAPPIQVEYVDLSTPTHFGDIHESALDVVGRAIKKYGLDAHLTFHLSPGTPAMAAVWVILAKTRFPAELIQSSAAHGVNTSSVPFDFSAEFVQDLLHTPDERLKRLSAGLPPETPEFAEILHRSAAMKRVVAMARRVAPRSVPVLLQGDSGTGKELFACAIHKASPRQNKSLLPVNCGAIAESLVESELFGYSRGAFTGATADKKGKFEDANGGTIFLDEIGDLPLAAQVKLLRVLQEGEVVPVGSNKAVKVNVRVIAATHRDLRREIAENRFREDLFYRLAVAVIQIPPLRERRGDVGLLIDSLLERVNKESTEEPGYKEKKLSTAARNVLLQNSWPGNVRELLNTLRRAALWSGAEDTISAQEIRDAILPARDLREGAILGRPIGDGIDLQNITNEVAGHYLQRALRETGGNKSKAAKLLGLGSNTTLNNWLKRVGDSSRSHYM